MYLKAKISPLLMRPAQLTDASTLQSMCWMDRSLDRIMDLLHRAQRLETNRRGLGAVATWDDRLCGFGMLTLWPRAAEISDLFVNAAYRGRGIGTSLIRYLTEAARELNAGTLEIGVALSNPRALALYRRLGFVDERTIEIDLGQGPEPVLYLQKYLEPYGSR